jgi:hypothetical protein
MDMSLNYSKTAGGLTALAKSKKEEKAESGA